MLDSLNFSTESYRPSERFTRYRDFYQPGADGVQIGANVAVEVHGWRLEGLVLYGRRMRGVGGERLADRVRQNQFDHFTLQLNLGGEFHGEGAQGFHAVRPGEILLLDMTRPMRTRMSDAHLITLGLPRKTVEAAALSVDDLHGLVIPARHGAPLASLLVSSVERMRFASSPLDAGVGPALATLLGAALNRMGLGRRLDGERSEEERREAARRFIRAHLADEALDPERVARATNLSRATLYRVFEGSGGVRKYIQAQRLVRLKGSLIDLHGAAPVSALAYDAGFASEHHASRSFRQEFGLPPAAFRRRARQMAQSPFGEQASQLKRRMLSWYAHLDV